MPKLWDETIEAHRLAVREATLETTAALVARHGLRSVTMSRIAEETGIGRATLYKYFSDVESILGAWHERQIAAHLHQLEQVRDGTAGTDAQLEAVLEAYALLSHGTHGHHDSELAAHLHGGMRVADAENRVHEMLRKLIAEAAAAGDVRDDTRPAELANYCVHALSAARDAASRAAVRRLVAVVLAGLRPQPPV